MLIQEKVTQALALLEEFDIDCWLTFTRESQMCGDPTLEFLLGGYVTWHSSFILSRKLGAVAIVGRYDRAAVEDTGAYDRIESFVKDYKPPLQDVMREIDPSRIALNWSVASEISDGLTHGMYLTLQDVLGQIGLADRFVSAEPLVSALRQRKTEAELAAIRGAIADTEAVYGLVAGFMRAGRTEREVASFVAAEFERRGIEPAWPASTCPAVFAGPNTAEAHYPPTDRVIERGMVVSMDMGTKRDLYCSDLQRTFYVPAEGETEAPAEVARAFAVVTESIERARKAMRPGITGVAVDAASRDYVTSNGYDEFPFALGHQVGRYAHDGTALLGPEWEKYGSKVHQALEPGMVFTIEPRVSVPGRGIVTVEDMVVVTDDGADYISTPQRELILVSE
jgi:Xaa-Pro aminopeptidase